MPKGKKVTVNLFLSSLFMTVFYFAPKLTKKTKIKFISSANI